MSINCNSKTPLLHSFKSNVVTPATSEPVNKSTETVSTNENVASQPKQRKSFKERIMDINKFFINAKNLTVGAAKGVFHGAVAGAATVGVVAIRNLVKHAPKVLGTKGKILAGAVGLGVLALDIVKAKLKSNEEGSKIDHRWKTGHND